MHDDLRAWTLDKTILFLKVANYIFKEIKVISLEMDVMNTAGCTRAIAVSASLIAQYEYIFKITREIAIL